MSAGGDSQVLRQPHQEPPSGWRPRCFVLDVDGVLNTGQYLYSCEGKAYKIFGADDHDALLLLKPFVPIRFVSGDRKGYPITECRVVRDMKMQLDLVSTIHRVRWLREQMDPADVVYMGDGIFDHYVFAQVGYSIAPGNGHPHARARANFVTEAHAGSGAVAEACLHLLERFFEPFDPERTPAQFGDGGEWGI